MFRDVAISLARTAKYAADAPVITAQKTDTFTKASHKLSITAALTEAPDQKTHKLRSLERIFLATSILNYTELSLSPLEEAP